VIEKSKPYSSSRYFDHDKTATVATQNVMAATRRTTKRQLGRRVTRHQATVHPNPFSSFTKREPGYA
jgi:hypothetical protein